MRLTRRNKVWPTAVFFDVGAADAAPADSELDLTISRRGRRRDVVDPHIAARMPSNCPHYTSLSGRCSEAVNVRTLRGVMFSSRNPHIPHIMKGLRANVRSLHVRGPSST